MDHGADPHARASRGARVIVASARTVSPCIAQEDRVADAPASMGSWSGIAFPVRGDRLEDARAS
jgi:hypothetical protein